MRLSLHTDYGLRILMFAASRSRRVTISEVAKFFGISKDHLAKVVQRLVRTGYVRSVRIGGGLELAKPLDRIRIGEVIESLEGNTHLLECVSAELPVCVIQPTCKLRSVLAKAERIQLEYLNSVLLSDLVQPGRKLVSIHDLNED